MYNRYVPQPDGTYRRNRIQDPQRQAPPVQPPFTNSAADCHEESVPPSNIPSYCAKSNPSQRKRQKTSSGNPISFLRQLLPADFDTEDLLVVILLLLMAGEGQEDRNNALLTLALYFFL